MATNRVYKNDKKNTTKKIKQGFNWWAFFFGGLWYILNGMVIKGILYSIMLILISIITGGIGGIIVLIILGFTSNREKENTLIKKGWYLVEDLYENDYIEENVENYSNEKIQNNTFGEPYDVLLNNKGKDSDLKNKMKFSLKSSLKKN